MTMDSAKLESYRLQLQASERELLFAGLLFLCLWAGILFSVWLWKLRPLFRNPAKSKRQKKERTKQRKGWYLALSLVTLLWMIGEICIGAQVYRIERDLKEDAYVVYEGPATLEEGKFRMIRYPKIRFSQSGTDLTLHTKEYYPRSLLQIQAPIYEAEQIYLVYSKHSQTVLEFRFPTT